MAADRQIKNCLLYTSCNDADISGYGEGPSGCSGRNDDRHIHDRRDVKNTDSYRRKTFMIIPNMHYADLKESYLFYNIAQKTKAYVEALSLIHI